jgi:tetratricopeptide (TPR) repeat protein
MVELGRNLESRKRFKEADDVLSRTVVLQRKLFGPEHPDVATSLLSAARVAETLGRVEDADRMRQQATEIRRRALGEHHPSFVRTLDATAASLERRGDLKPAESLRRQALDIRLRYHHDDPGMVPQSIVGLVENLQQQGRPEEAISEVRRVLPRQSQNPRPEESFIRCSALTILSQLLIDADRAAEAEENYHACIRLLPSVAEALPADLWKWAANRAAMGLGWLLLQQERYADAEEHYRVMLPLLRKGFGESYNCCAHLPDLIETYLGVGKAHEAERVCSEAMAMLRPNSPIHERGLVMLAQARVLAHVGTAAAADRAFAEAIDYLRNATTRPSRECDIMLSRQAEALFDAGRLADAEALRRVELDVEVALSGDTHPLVANSLIALASVLRAAGKPADAEEAARRALAIRRKRWPATNPYAVAEALLELGRTLCDEGKADDAEPLLREATALRTTAPRPNAWSIAHAKSHLGRALVMQRRYEEAEKLLIDAASTLESAPAPWQKLRQANLERLAQLYDACGKGEEAAKVRIEALKVGNAPTTGPAFATPATTSPSTRP